MSHIIASGAIRGAHSIAGQARKALAASIEKNGKDCHVEFPNTAYSLPVIHSMLGLSPETLGDLEEVMVEIDGLLPAFVSEDVWVPYLGFTMDAGMATLFAEEIIEKR